MSSDLIPLSFYKVMQSRFYTLFILKASGRPFAIYTHPSVGENIQFLLEEKRERRPMTHLLLSKVIEGMDARVLQAVFYKVEKHIYHAHLFIEQPSKESTCFLEIDARPSDCLTLALVQDLPLFCKKEIFEKLCFIEPDSEDLKSKDSLV